MERPIFDFSRAPALVERTVLFGDDLVERTSEVGNRERWVELVVAPSGERFMWAWSDDFEDGEEALAWLATVRQ